MKKILLFICAITIALPVVARQTGSKPVNVTVKINPDTDQTVLEMILTMRIAPGVHVYTSKDAFFEIHESVAENLGKTTVVLPEPEPFLNFDGTTVEVFTGTKEIVVRKPYTGRKGEPWSLSGYLQFQGCTDTTCYPPQRVPFSFKGTTPSNTLPVSSSEETQESTASPYSGGLLWGIIGSFIAGILLSLTPCVYPMVGITVAVIGAKQASKKESFLLTFVYILGLSLVYAGAGIIVAMFGSVAASFLRSAWVLVPIGVVFVLLGLSMFDIVTIQTSSAFSAKIQVFSAKFKGSYAGTFLIGALSAFVVGPCVSGPLISLITFVATTGDLLRGFAYFFALAWGMGIVLFVAGTMSSALPKAGVWMERIKHTIGIVLIWAAFYFTRPFIGETMFMTVCIVALAAGLNSIGLLRMPAGTDGWKGFVRLLCAFFVLGGFVFYQLNTLEQDKPDTEYAKEIVLDSILAQSEKPVILDFSAPWCVICKEIEETTLSLPEIKEKLKQFTFVHVDFDSNPALVEKFGVIGPPAFIFLDNNGKRIGKITVTGEELKQRLLKTGF